MAVKVGLCGDTENSEQVRIGRPVPDHWIGLSWYVASVTRGTDHEARASLEAAGVPVFMVEGREVRRRRGVNSKGRYLIDYPAFAGYLFVADFAGVCTVMRGLSRPSITGFLGAGSPGGNQYATRVNGAVMQGLFAMHESAYLVPKDMRDALRARIRIGDFVEIIDGPMSYLSGIVQKFRNGEDVEFLTEILGRKTPIVIPLDSVERLNV